ncbi:MAG TPA: UbiA family prenyltransferase, partial [Spirochaetia bacterium]|nr:UbiA family prenyltransferase [Spirochaetia bacterium]
MTINLAMWKRATTTLVRMDSKSEWDALDVVSKWLIATRSGVAIVTVYSCVIAGMFALRAGVFSFLPWIVMTVGLFLAHGANNLLNDYTDFSRGIDTNNYFRTQYGVHPLVQGFWGKAAQMRWFVVSGALAVVAAAYAIWFSGFDPVTIGLFVYGSLMLLLYTYPLKHIAI